MSESAITAAAAPLLPPTPRGLILGQLIPAFITSFSWFFDAQQTFISAFADAVPPWSCSSCSSPPTVSSLCSLPPNSTWSWTLPPESSTVSTWSLQCDSPAVLSLPSSSFFAGCLVGGVFLPTLADSPVVGRKNVLLLSSILMSISAILSATSPSLAAYSAFRFLSGIGRAAIGSSALVLSIELVPRRWRDHITVLGYFSFTAGFLSLPIIAYATREGSWRVLYLLTALPALLHAAAIFFFVPESLAWILLVNGRRMAAGGLNGDAKASEEILGKTTTASHDLCSIQPGMDTTGEDTFFSAGKRLWQSRQAFRRLMALMVVSFGVGSVYYGMPLNLGNLSSNLYISVALNALTELPSAILFFFLVGRVNRRSSTLLLTTASGLLALACAAIGGGWMEIAAELASFFAACTAFNIVLKYSIELFETRVRNTALGMVRQALVMGGVFAPIIVAMGRGNRPLSFGVLGLIIGCCGAFVACLPQIRVVGATDSMEEEEEEAFKRVVVQVNAH